MRWEWYLTILVEVYISSAEAGYMYKAEIPIDENDFIIAIM